MSMSPWWMFYIEQFSFNFFVFWVWLLTFSCQKKLFSVSLLHLLDFVSCVMILRKKLHVCFTSVTACYVIKRPCNNYEITLVFKDGCWLLSPWRAGQRNCSPKFEDCQNLLTWHSLERSWGALYNALWWYLWFFNSSIFWDFIFFFRFFLKELKPMQMWFCILQNCRFLLEKKLPHFLTTSKLQTENNFKYL
jgi:hypothetical protein